MSVDEARKDSLVVLDRPSLPEAVHMSREIEKVVKELEDLKAVRFRAKVRRKWHSLYVTIPKQLAEMLNLRPGDEVEVVVVRKT